MYTAKGQLDVNSMLQQYSPLVRRLAHQMIAKLPANVDVPEFVKGEFPAFYKALFGAQAEREAAEQRSMLVELMSHGVSAINNCGARRAHGPTPSDARPEDFNRNRANFGQCRKSSASTRLG